MSLRSSGRRCAAALRCIVAAGGGTCAECVISRQCSATSSLVSAGCTPRAEPYRAKHAFAHSLPVLTLGGSSWGLRWIAPTSAPRCAFTPPHTRSTSTHTHTNTRRRTHASLRRGLGVRSPARLRRTARCSHHFRTHCRGQGRAQRVQMCKCARIKRVPCVRVILCVYTLPKHRAFRMAAGLR